ncbi:hypothetical protein V8E54_006290 [Elaphomyces granulatus]
MQLPQFIITLFLCVAAVQAGPVAPAPAPGNNNVAAPSGTSTSPNTQNTASGYKYCYCIDGQNNVVNTATNTVYQGYIQAGSFDKDVAQLNYSNGVDTATCENDKTWDGDDFKAKFWNVAIPDPAQGGIRRTDGLNREATYSG